MQRKDNLNNRVYEQKQRLKGCEQGLKSKAVADGRQVG